jgi:acetyltransferase-like isoleucine patch superfamily enzyme
VTQSRKSNFVFLHFSFLQNLILPLLEVVPPFIRVVIFRILFSKLGKNSMLDYRCYFRYPSKISIGDNVSINRGCEFYPSHAVKGARIAIGNNVTIAPNVVFFGAGQNIHLEGLPDIAESITVHEGVYIGGNSIIRYGVTIGENSVIAAGSVVVKDVPPNVVVGGNPAKVLRSR